MPENNDEIRIGDFLLNEEGVFYIDQRGENEDVIHVCSPLAILHKTRNAEGTDWGKVCSFFDPEENEQIHHFHNSSLTGNGTSVVADLVRKGLTVSGHPRSRTLLAQYLRSTNPKSLVLSSKRQGWVRNSFVLPDRSFGAEEVIYSGPSRGSERAVAGDWKTNVGKYCSGNSRLILSASAAFAPTLLGVVGMEGGGFYIRGTSSKGKSTALYVAASVCGSRSTHFLNFDATKNALEEVAEAHNDGLLIADELGMADGKVIGDAIYMLSNGRGKSRMKAPTTVFQVLTLASGELPLAEKMAQSGKQTMNGQEVRFLDIAADAGVGMGLFERLHSFSEPKLLAEYLDGATRKNHGEPLRQFIEIVTSNRHEIEIECRRIIEDFAALVTTPGNSDGQVSRAIRRFGLVAAAGEIATANELTGWKEGEAIDAAHKCFMAWMEHRRSYDPVAKAVDRVKQFILANEDNFGRAGGPVVENSVGFKKRNTFLIQPDVFRDVVCIGTDHEEVADGLERAGYLNTSGPNRKKKQERIEGQLAYFYSVSESLLEAA